VVRSVERRCAAGAVCAGIQGHGVRLRGGGKYSVYVCVGEIANGPVPVCQILVLRPSCRDIIYLSRIEFADADVIGRRGPAGHAPRRMRGVILDTAI
jgi:hypothetical protein